MVDMFMDEYDEEKIARLFRRDGYREGRLEVLASLVRDGLLDISVAADHFGIAEDEIRRAVEAKEQSKNNTL